MGISQTKKKRVVLFSLLLFSLQLAGCASVQKDVANFLKNLGAVISDIAGGSRTEAAQRYGYRGRHDEIFTEAPVITPAVARLGDNMRHELQYAILSPQSDKRFIVSEVVVLSGTGETIGLAQRETEKPQGIHISTVQFEIPSDLDPGTYKIITTISSGNLKKIVQGEFVVRR